MCLARKPQGGMGWADHWGCDHARRCPMERAHTAPPAPCCPPGPGGRGRPGAPGAGGPRGAGQRLHGGRGNASPPTATRVHCVRGVQKKNTRRGGFKTPKQRRVWRVIGQEKGSLQGGIGAKKVGQKMEVEKLVVSAKPVGKYLPSILCKKILKIKN